MINVQVMRIVIGARQLFRHAVSTFIRYVILARKKNDTLCAAFLMCFVVFFPCIIISFVFVFSPIFYYYFFFSLQ